jgi:serine/threonine-protein kinase
MIGWTLSHYKVLEKIGEGGMGQVYRAHDERLDRDIAIKVLPAGTLADEHARKRFRKEALALSKLNHSNIATVHDFDTQEGVDFIVMELVEGTTLAEKLKSGPLTEKEICSIGTQIADALEDAHERGIVHRDLKPGNIAVTPKGRVKVLDFGLARMLRPVSDEATTEALSQELAVAGTLPYMSPEELRGEKADHRSDLFSFGIVLYEMATGRRPFEHTISTALVDAIIHKAPEPPSAHNRTVSPGLEHIISKALDKNPDHRYQSAREMRADLERLSAPAPVTAAARKRSSIKWLWATAIIAAVLAVLLALDIGGLRERWMGGAGELHIDSVAVLPLENLSGDPEQDIFADAMTEAVILNLAKIEALRIISRQSVMRYKNTDTPLPEIAQALDVDALVEGSVQKSGDRVLVTTQLVQADPEKHLWAESYERDLSDILSLQNEVAREIAREIEITVTPEEQERLRNTRPVDPEAHDSFLQAHLYLQSGRREKALESALEATKKDPNFPQAQALLSSIYSQLPYFSARTPEECYPKARAAAMKALELDDVGHVPLAYINAAEWKWSAAEEEYERALELFPGNAGVHFFYSALLRRLGRHEEDIAEAQRALDLDPITPDMRFNLGRAYLHAGRYDEAIEKTNEFLELQPNSLLGRLDLGAAYQEKGMYEDAIAEYKKARDLSRGGAWENGHPAAHANLAYTYAVSGRRDEALAILDELKEEFERNYLPPTYVATVYAGLGDKDQAFQWLEKAYDKRDAELTWLKVNRKWAPIRDDPRFEDLLRRVNLLE